MDEDKREKIREAVTGDWVNLDRRASNLERDVDIFHARQRAKLSVLDLTERDKRFLKDLKIAV